MVTVTKQANGSLLLSKMHKGRFVAMQYYGYTVNEARKEFSAYLRGVWT